MDVKWTDERAKQLDLLEGLLMDLEMLDRGSNFLSHTQECIETATLLRKLDLDKLEESFLGFLKELCRTERIEKAAIDNVHKASSPATKKDDQKDKAIVIDWI